MWVPFFSFLSTLWIFLLLGPVFWSCIGEIIGLFYKTSNWAPFDIPWARRKQMASMVFFSSSMWSCLILTLCCIVHIRFTWWWFIPYLTFCIFDKTPFRGSRRWNAYRRMSVWRHCRDYFPVTIVKDQPDELFKTDRPYIFGYHPHGVLTTGMMINFGTDVNDTTNLFPGLNIFPATLSLCLRVPFLRELVIPWGAISVSRSSLEHVLKKGGGYGVIVVVGGAQEAILSKPQTHDLVILRRRGLFRLALEYGSYIVPVYGFGETNVYTPWTSLINQTTKLSDMLRRLFGCTFPIFKGRGVFQYDFGLMPQRKPIITVVGSPIPCRKIADPTEDDIEEIREIYCTSLRTLFEENKAKYCTDPDEENLRFVE